MTGDLGPGEVPADDLSAAFDAYRISAAGLASERQDERLAGLLDAAGLEARFAEFPVTSSHGKARASVDVVLRVASAQAAAVGDDTRGQLAGLLNEVVESDGYRVREVRVEADPGVR